MAITCLTVIRDCYNNMKKLLFTMILVSFVSCKSQDTKLNELKSCLEKKEIEVLEDGLVDFESSLAKQYEGLDKEESYVQFLIDFINMDIPPDFFLNSESESTRKRIKELRIWRLTEELDEGMEVEIRLDGSEPEKNSGMWTLTNEFQNCITDKISSEGIKNFLKIRTEVPDISPRLSAVQIYNGFKEEEFSSKLNRLVIAIGVFYEFSLNIEK